MNHERQKGLQYNEASRIFLDRFTYSIESRRGGRLCVPRLHTGRGGDYAYHDCTPEGGAIMRTAPPELIQAQTMACPSGHTQNDLSGQLMMT
jgi:hypothetical protein